MPDKKRIYNISRRIALPALLTVVLFVTAIFFIILPQFEKSFLARKKEMIREQVETTCSLLGDYHNRALSGELTTGEAKLRAILRIGKLRYGPENKDYFWINDMTPRILMHPYRPDLVKKDVGDFKDPHGKRLFFEMVQLVKKREAGYVDYMWQWKDDPNKVVPKISFVKGFAPWGWVIGTGVYINDVQAEIASMRKRLSAIATGILFIVMFLALYSIRQSIIADRERENLLRSLEKSTLRFRNIVETTSDWIWEIDKVGKLTYSSPQVTEVLGYSTEEIMENNLLTLASPNQATIMGPSFNKILADANPFKGFEITCFGKNGQVVVFENNGVPIFDERGNVTGYRGVARDITERKIATEALKKSRDELHASLEETVKTLSSTVEKRDPYIAGHQQRVDFLACAIGRELGLSEERIEGLHIAALLHDLGMIALPSEYLTKPSRLSKEEIEIMRCHPEFGYQILRNIQFQWPVADIVYQHHEHLDGSGYPKGLCDQEIHLEAKIIAVADVFESMISHRPYRPALGMTKALEELRNGKGIRYHAASVEACIRLVSENNANFFSEVEDSNL